MAIIKAMGNLQIDFGDSARAVSFFSILLTELQLCQKALTIYIDQSGALELL